MHCNCSKKNETESGWTRGANYAVHLSLIKN